MTTCPLWLIQISTNKWNAHQNQTFGMSIKPLRTGICFHTKIINAWLTLFPSHSNSAQHPQRRTSPHRKSYKDLLINSSPQLSWSTSIFVILNEPKNRKNKTNVNYTRRKSVATRKDLKIHLARLLFNILLTSEFGVELFGRHGLGCIWHKA